MGFRLETRDGTLLSTAIATQNGVTVSTTYNTGNNSNIFLYPIYVINSTYTNLTEQIYFVANTCETQYSFSVFNTNLKRYVNEGIFGITDFSFGLIIFIIIFVFVGLMSYQFGLQNPAAISALTAGVVLFFDIGLGLIDAFRYGNMVIGFPSIIISIIAISLIIREATR